MTPRRLLGPAMAILAAAARGLCAKAGVTPSPAGLVKRFHIVFGLPVADAAQAAFPSRLAADRLALLQEEVDELAQAFRDRDVQQAADALADVVYVTYGTALSLGVDLDAVLREVHRSNMSKRVPGTPSRLGAHGKVVKPPGWRPPDIAALTGPPSHPGGSR